MRFRHFFPTLALAVTTALAGMPTDSFAARGGSRSVGRVTMDRTYKPHMKPREVRQITYPSGRKDTFYGNQRRVNGSIVGRHGHVVQGPDGKVEYARTMRGTVLKNTKRHVPKTAQQR
jgi:hypothetical protein